DMNDITNPSLFVRRSKIKMDMFSLKEYEYNGRSLLDWLVLYNFVVNKNRYGEEKMTTIFQPLINDESDNLLKDYYNYVIEVDNSASDMAMVEKDEMDNGTFHDCCNMSKSMLNLKYGNDDFNIAIAVSSKKYFTKRKFICVWDKNTGDVVLKERNDNGMYSRSYADMGLNETPNQMQINNFKCWYPYKIHNGKISIEEE
ncbi:MAG: hypothetical protein WCU80_07315, partial [Paludibacteraceae bacterium]